MNFLKEIFKEDGKTRLPYFAVFLNKRIITKQFDCLFGNDSLHFVIDLFDTIRE